MLTIKKIIRSVFFRRLLMIFAAVFFCVPYSTAQIHTRVSLSPRLKIGWTFFSGFNYGIDLTVGLVRLKENNPEINVGISPQYMLVNYKGNVHSVLSFNAVIESDYYRLHIGMGTVMTKWGFNNRNSNNALGYNVGIALSTESVYTPWVECNVFALHHGYWEFYGKPYYLSTSVFFRSEPYLLYETK